MKEIVIITTGWFPEGDAGAVRLKMMAKCLTEANFHVTVLCRGKEHDKGTVEGIDYISLRYKRSRLGKAYDYFTFPARVKRYLKKNADSLHGVYIYNAHISVFEFCKSFCSSHGIRLFHDCVEWYSPEEFKNGERNVWYRNKVRINTKIIDHRFSVIAISRYLDDYFSSRGIKTMRVPILCDSASREHPKAENGEKLTLFYAGTPLRKDLVGNLLKAALLLTKEEQKMLRIVFVGVTREGLINGSDVPPDVIDGCSEFLELVGRVPRHEVLRRMEEADFSILLRDASLTYAKAGFPSKIVEALSNATPVFCNLSSDLEEYLEDGKNSVIPKDHTVESVTEAIRRALSLTPEEKNTMSKNALETAKSNFDYRQYTKRFYEFFN